LLKMLAKIKLHGELLLSGLMPSTGLCRVLSAPSALEVRRALVLNSGRV